MKTIKVNRTELLDTVKKNKEKHVSEHKQARAAWYVESLTTLDTLLINMRKNPDLAVPIHILDVEPESHESDYDRTIAMLEMSVDDIIDLDHDEFERYVRDDWQWKRAFAASTMRYLG